MCNRGTWRGFHTRYLKTPDGVDSPLVAMEQCTECGDYRALNIEGMQYVDPENDAQGIPDDPQADDGGSVWGGQSSNSDGW